MKRPGIVIAAPCSGSGKTLFTAGLLAALKGQGRKVYPYKCGPDYIDPMFHECVLKTVSSRNLDTFFTGEEGTRRLYLEMPDDGIHVVEGVMGLYDGVAGTEETGSTYDLARVLKLPVLLVVNARGQGRSLVATLKGFLAMDQEKLIRGVFLNRVTEEFYRRLRPMIERETGLPVLGFLPGQKELTVESRHLGLVGPGELSDDWVKAVKDAVESHLDWEKFFEIAGSAERPGSDTKIPGGRAAAEEADIMDGSPVPEERKLRLAVARDAAFSFLYRENLQMLEEAGAELVFFSPLQDQKLPEEIDGLLLSGGYPELYAEQLSGNQGMLESVRSAVQAGCPTVAECGGFLYLQQELQGKDGAWYPMAGVLPGKAKNEGHPVRFGYVLVKEKKPVFLKKETELKGHEFHYYDSTENGTDCDVTKPVTGKKWEAIVTGERLWAGFPHLYYPACPGFAEAFAGKMKAYREERK